VKRDELRRGARAALVSPMRAHRFSLTQVHIHHVPFHFFYSIRRMNDLADETTSDPYIALVAEQFDHNSQLPFTRLCTYNT
jgi:hypothetical protein